MLDILYHLFYCYNLSLIRESNTLTQKSKKKIEITNTGKKKREMLVTHTFAQLCATTRHVASCGTKLCKSMCH